MARIALLIGVSDYEPGLAPLPGSGLDVDAMQRVLCHPDMGGFAEADLTILKNPQRQQMEEAIYQLFANRQKDDLLLFYFSGHGLKDDRGRLYLATRNTLDIRGSRVADAEPLLDRALAEGDTVLWVIHGHGTGKLRQGVHAFLQQHSRVSHFTLAEPQDGGSGVTIVHLKD